MVAQQAIKEKRDVLKACSESTVLCREKGPKKGGRTPSIEIIWCPAVSSLGGLTRLYKDSSSQKEA